MKFENVYQKIFYILFAVALIALPIMSFDVGISGDEYVHSEQSKRVIEFYTSGFQNKDAATTGVLIKDGENGNIYLYGQSLDVIAYLVSKVLFFMDIYDVRHLVNILFGLLGIFVTAMIVKRIAGWRAALIALIVFLVSLRFIGHSMNNLKDAPFAVAYAIGLYGIIRYLSELPKPSKKTLAIVVLGLALPFSIRAGGLLLFAYLGMFTVLHYIFMAGIKELNAPHFTRHIKKYALYTISIFVGAYFLGIVLWPYALLDPISNPLNALTKFSNFSVGISQLFEGQNVASKDLPNYYLAKYIAITMPLVVLAGLALFVGLIYKFRKEYKLETLLFIVFSLVFPIAYILYKGANVYGGWRHVLFVAPPLIVLSALGWELLIRFVKTDLLKKVVFAVIIALAIIPVQWGVRNYPNFVTYFNPTVGGIKGAYTNYETDYYYTSLKGSFEWLIKNTDIIEESKKRQVKVASNVWWSFRPYFEGYDSIIPKYVRYYERSKQDWDYAIFSGSYIRQYQLQHDIWPPQKRLYAESADGVPLSAVSARPSKDDYYGFQAIDKKDYETAITKFEAYLIIDPRNESVQEALGNAYLQTKNYNGAIKALDLANRLNPGSPNCMYSLGIAYANAGKFDNAIYTLNGVLQAGVPPQVAKGIYQTIGNLYQQKGDAQNAKRYLDAASRM